MIFTPEQARSVAGLSKETVRHWRQAVPYLATKTGKAARFTFTEIVGLAAAREATSRFGMSIAEVGVGVSQLMELFSRASWTHLEEEVILLRPQAAEIIDRGSLAGAVLDESVLVIPCGPVFERVRSSLLSGHRDAQSPILFPPVQVSPTARARSARVPR